jgi:predicted anti-sigma-YlaC factor YlaD
MLKEDCIKTIELLSEYHDKALGETEYVWVRAHLVECPPCAGIFQELEIIVVNASILRVDDSLLAFPDEDAVWQRMRIGRDNAN